MHTGTSNMKPDIIYGRAFDNINTRNCHQIISSSYDPDRSRNMLHYTVKTSSNIQSDKLGEFTDNLKDVLYDPKAAKNKAYFLEAHKRFSRLLAGLDKGARSGFIKNTPCDSITCDIEFNSDKKIKHLSLRRT